MSHNLDKNYNNKILTFSISLKIYVMLNNYIFQKFAKWDACFYKSYKLLGYSNIERNLSSINKIV